METEAPVDLMEMPVEIASNHTEAETAHKMVSPNNGVIFLGGIIGQGSFGKASKAKNTKNVQVKVRWGIVADTGMNVAVKIVKTVDAREKLSVEREITYFERVEERRLRFTGIPKFIEAFNIGRDCTCLVLELLGPSLADTPGVAYPNAAIKHIGLQVLDALSYLHSIAITHGDVKLSNICTTTDGRNVKLIDLGCAINTVYLQEYCLDAKLVSIPYRPPEVLYGLPKCSKVDIWAAGVVLCHLFSGSLMFPALSEIDLVNYHFMTDLMPYNFTDTTKYEDFFTLDKRTVRFQPLSNGQRFHRRIAPFTDMRDMKLKKVSDILQFGMNARYNISQHDPVDLQFVQVIEHMLRPEADHRCNALQALNMSFFQSP